MLVLLILISAIALPSPAGGIEITILYNNVPHTPGCVCQWGFACLIRGTEETVLFDTGGDGRVLLANMELLGVDPSEIDCVVLSHSHGDHTGGVAALLPQMKPVRWYIPEDFAASLRKPLQRAGHTLIPVSEHVEICSGVYSSGELGSAIKEQSLIVETNAGLILITGCAHPGIVEITATARTLRNREIHLILGGFHLGSYSDAQLARIIEELQALGVEKVAPSHCSGAKAIGLFADTWKEDCISSGCGARITVP